MTQFIKVTVISDPFGDQKYRILYINANCLQRIEPAVVGGAGATPTKIVINEYNSGSGNWTHTHQEFFIKETPEEILAQLR